MTRRPPKNRPIRLKLGIAGAGLLLSVCVLEIGLRTAGDFIARRQRRAIPSMTSGGDGRKDGKTVTILALGDSFTFGGASRARKSYPAVLSRMLNSTSAKTRYNVINNGMCESTSRQIRDALAHAIELHRPDFIVLLTGSSNMYDFGAFSEEFDEPLSRLGRLAYRLRTLKMLRFIFRELEYKIRNSLHRSQVTRWKDVGIAEPENDVRSGMRRFKEKYRSYPGEKLIAERSRLDAEIDAGRASTETYASAGWISLRLAEPEKGGAYFKKALELAPASRRLRAFLAWAYWNQEYKKSPADHVELALKAILLDPAHYLYYSDLIRQFQRQSRFKAGDLIAVFKKILSDDPGQYGNHALMSGMKYLKDRRVWEERLKGWIRQDLEDIIRISRENGVRLILQNYPLRYPVPNSAAAEASKRHSLPFVDNYSAFQKLIGGESGKRAAYIKDDDHCTDLGHEIMAENVFRAIKGNAPAGVLRRSAAEKWRGLMAQADVRLGEGRGEDAVAALREALAAAQTRFGPRDERSIAALGKLGAAYRKMGDLAESAAALRTALRRKPGSRWLRAELAKTLARQGRRRKAGEILRPAPESERKNAREYIEMGYFEMGRGRMPEAKAAFEAAAAGGPDGRLGRHHLASYYRRKGDYARAEAQLRIALGPIEGSPAPSAEELAHTRANLAEIYRKQDRLAEAEALYKKVLAMEGISVLDAERPAFNDHVLDSMAELGWVYERQGRDAEAETAYRRGFEFADANLPPSRLRARIAMTAGLARIRNRQGRWPQARRLAKEALALHGRIAGSDPSAGGLLVVVAGLFQDLGLYSKAEDLYRRVIFQEGDRGRYRDARSALARLAQICREERRIVEAETFYRRALELRDRSPGPSPSERELLDGLAVILDERGRRGEKNSF